MAKSPASKREEQHEVSRRALIQWSVAAGAALGVSRAKIFDILERVGGKELAHAAATNPTNRSIFIAWGNGGLAWCQLLWPHPKIGLSGNAAFAYHLPGQATLFPGTTKPFVTGPDTPFLNLPAAQQMTCFVAGNNETHTNTPAGIVTLNGANIVSIAGALQSSTASVLPMITIDDVDAGNAAGAPRPSNVNNANGIVNLFNSAASRAGGLLAMPQNASLYKAQYDAFSQLNRAANRSTTKSAYKTASGAANFLGTNLSAKLQVTQTDLDRYGVTGATRGDIAEMARGFIIGVKAFQMGLTNSIVMPGLRNDPHGAFADGTATSVPPQLKKIFDSLMTDLATAVDSNTLASLKDNTVIANFGDTTKDPRDRSGWPDGTSANSSAMYVWGAGNLSTGWFGDYDTQGNVKASDGNGALVTYNGANAAKIATTAVAWAVAKRDDRLISGFTNNTAIPAIGKLKDI
jgi:hypothetical protein